MAGRSRGCERISPRHRSNPQRKKTVVIPEFSAWLTFVLERCRAENIRNLPRQRAPTPLFPERRPREACSMPISGCHDLPLATFNSPVVNTRPTPEQPPRKKQHRHSGIFRVADLRPGTMPRGKYPESPAPAGSHALISRTPTPGGMLHANLGLPRPPPRNFQPPLPRFPSRLSPRRMSGMTTGGFFHMLSRGQHMLRQQPSKQTATAPH